MKRLNPYRCAAVAAALGAAVLTSCSDDGDNYSYYYAAPNALVTVKPTSEGAACLLQLNDSVALRPINLSRSPFGTKEVRALANLVPVSGRDGVQQVYVNWIDSIRTKAALHAPEHADTLGNDPVEIVKDWVSLAEDGYLTLRFRTRWGNGQTTHLLNLTSGSNPNDPYELNLYHNAQGDTLGHWGDALIAFSLDSLPDTQDSTVRLTLRWRSYSGMKSAQFDFRSRQSTGDLAPARSDTYSSRVQ